MDDAESLEFYRYMSRDEARAVGEPGDIGYLRGGRPGETHWTTEFYGNAEEARTHLALEEIPEVRMRFRITSWPSRRLKEGSYVSPKHGQCGGGLEWMTEERVEVKVIDVDDITR